MKCCCGKKVPYLASITYALIIIGAINWGLVGLFGLDLVALIFGHTTILTRITYTLVGLAAVINLALRSAHSSENKEAPLE